jgi:hypothetical protein
MVREPEAPWQMPRNGNQVATACLEVGDGKS